MAAARASTSELTLEPLRSDHAAAMFEGLSDPAGYRFLAEMPPVDRWELQDRYTRQIQGGSVDGSEVWLNWIVRSHGTGLPVGYTQATIAQNEALIGYHLFPACWGSGFGTVSVQLMLAILFDRPDVQRVVALVDTRNLASIALLRRLGFRLARTIIEADHFKGSRSDEHEFVLERS